MDAFSLIQNFFTRMRCNFCSHTFSPEDIQLIRQDDSIFIVNVYCNHCETQNGVAMVGVEMPDQDGRAVFRDPELTEEELERLSEFKPISADDVLEAHEFFSNLGSDWMRFIPEEMRQPQTGPDTEFEDD